MNVVRAYTQLFVETGLQANGIHCGLSLAEFKARYSLFAFDLTPDRTPKDLRINLLRQGKLNFNLKFGTVLPHPVSVIVYTIYDKLIQLTSDRIPVTDFSMKTGELNHIVKNHPHTRPYFLGTFPEYPLNHDH